MTTCGCPKFGRGVLRGAISSRDRGLARARNATRGSTGAAGAASAAPCGDISRSGCLRHLGSRVGGDGGLIFQAAARYSLMRPPSLGCCRTRVGSGRESMAAGWVDEVRAGRGIGEAGVGCSGRHIGEGSLEVTAPEDQDPVEAFSSYGSDPTFRVRIRDRRAHGGADDAESLAGEDLVERGAELGVPISIRSRRSRSAKSPMTFRACWVVHDPVGCAVTPARRTRRRSRSRKNSTESRRSPMVSTVKKSEADDMSSLGMEEPTPRVAVSLGAQLNTGALENRPDRRGSDLIPEAQEFTGDAPVSPRGVLAGEAYHERLEASVGRRSAPGMRVRPVTGDESTVPAQQRRRSHQEHGPRPSVQHPTQARQDHPIAVREVWVRDLAAKDVELLAQHEDLDILGPITPTAQHQQPPPRRTPRK